MSSAALGQQTTRLADEGPYSISQAGRGLPLFVENCAACHGTDLTGDPYAPPLAGAGFVAKWQGRPLSALFDLTQRTMPQTFAGG